MKCEKCSGGKHSKVRLTGMAAAGAAGEKLPIFVIGKSAKQDALKTSKTSLSLSIACEKLDEQFPF